MKKTPPPKLDNNQLTMIILIFITLFVIILSYTFAPQSTPPITQSQSTVAPRPTLVENMPIVIPTYRIIKTYPGGGKMIDMPPLDPRALNMVDKEGTPIKPCTGPDVLTKSGKPCMIFQETPDADSPSTFIDVK